VDAIQGMQKVSLRTDAACDPRRAARPRTYAHHAAKFGSAPSQRACFRSPERRRRAERAAKISPGLLKPLSAFDFDTRAIFTRTRWEPALRIPPDAPGPTRSASAAYASSGQGAIQRPRASTPCGQGEMPAVTGKSLSFDDNRGVTAAGVGLRRRGRG